MPPSMKMRSSMATFFDTISSCSILASPSTSSFIYRDELNKKPSPIRKKVTKKDDYGMEKREPLLVSSKEEDYSDKKNSIASAFTDHQDDQPKGVIRVKVKMTREEAVRLMSKCKEGGVIGFKDVANELVRIPTHLLTVVSNSGGGSCGVLESIPEEGTCCEK